MPTETIVTNGGADQSGHAQRRVGAVEAATTHWAGSAVGLVVVAAEVLLCCAQRYLRTSPVADLYCLSNFLECAAPRLLLVGSEACALAFAVLMTLPAVGINLLTRHRLLALNAAVLASLAAASSLLIGENEIGQLCNLDKTFTLGGIAWADLNNGIWMRTWIGVLPLGGVPIQLALATLSLFAAWRCRAGSARPAATTPAVRA